MRLVIWLLGGILIPLVMLAVALWFLINLIEDYIDARGKP